MFYTIAAFTIMGLLIVEFTMGVKSDYDHYERKQRMTMYNLYSSKRFKMIGNLMQRIEITDLNDNKVYILREDDLDRFRKNYAKAGYALRDALMTATISHRTADGINEKVA